MHSEDRSPLVSVIIPCFNYGNFISRAMDSLLLQTSKDWECIVVDNGSTDITQQVCTEYTSRDRRFTYFRQKSGGPSSGRNQGLILAKGKYIQFLDADDLLARRKLEVQSAYLEKETGVDLVYGPVGYFSSDMDQVLQDKIENLSNAKKDGHSGSGKKLHSLLIRSNIFVTNAPMIRRSVIDLAGPFNEEQKYLEDWEFWLRCSGFIREFRFLDVEYTTAMVRFHTTSLSRNFTRMKSWYLPVLLANFRPMKAPLIDSVYIFMLYEEEFLMNLFRKERMKLLYPLFESLGNGNRWMVFTLFLILLPLYLPFFILIRLYRQFQ
ncbi:MAG TPA: glycosyltransferase family 2 protein [Bacteroidia bacterium]|nr:glycosyltransferase family 2 protein [Bacteroidia bacterium]